MRTTIAFCVALLVAGCASGPYSTGGGYGAYWYGWPYDGSGGKDGHRPGWSRDPTSHGEAGNEAGMHAGRPGRGNAPHVDRGFGGGGSRGGGGNEPGSR